MRMAIFLRFVNRQKFPLKDWNAERRIRSGDEKLIILGVLSAMFGVVGCEKVVELNSTDPMEVVYCSAPDSLMGDWISDSVHIETYTDSTDTTVIDRSPSLQYDMRIGCGEDTLFRLRYFNFSGVLTEDINSKNYIVSPGAIYVFNPMDASTNTEEAERALSYTSPSQDRITAVIAETLNDHQSTTTTIFFRKD